MKKFLGCREQKFLGYYEHLSDLPIKRGDRVRILKGAIVYSMRPKGTKAAGRNFTVTVVSVGCGQNFPEGHPRHDKTYPVRNPEVTWVGSGGYWQSADINDVVSCT
jgi:hypothetical protein